MAMRSHIAKEEEEKKKKTTFANQLNSLLVDLATELFQRGPDYYFVWAWQDFLFKVAGKGQKGAKPGEHSVRLCKCVSLSQPTMTGRPVPNPAVKVQNVQF